MAGSNLGLILTRKKLTRDEMFVKGRECKRLITHCIFLYLESLGSIAKGSSFCFFENVGSGNQGEFRSSAVPHQVVL